MSRIPVPRAKHRAVESSDLEEAMEVGIQYQETSYINLSRIKREANIDYQNQSLLQTIGQDFPQRKKPLILPAKG